VISLLPALLLFFTKVLISEDLSFLKQHYWVPFALFGFYLIIILIYGGLILTLSSLGKGARFAGIGFFAIYVLTDLIKKILAFEPNIGVISIGADVKQIGDFIFGLPVSSSFPVWLAAVVLLLVSVFCFFVLNSQVRGTDIVK